MADRNFLVGETVILRMKVSKAGTKNPGDPIMGCRLVGLSRAGVAVGFSESQFTKVSDGEYVLALNTISLTPGTYSWMAEARDSATLVSLSEDSFLLKAPVTATLP